MFARDVFNLPVGRNLDDLVEIALFDAEREHLNFTSNALLRRNGKVRSPRPFSSSSEFLGDLIEQLKFKKIPFSIKYSSSDSVGFCVIVNGVLFSSEKLPEALSKAVGANFIQNGKVIR